ncbi:MAG: hypothetical protein LCH58_05980 [Bacteroidetes bacterium]|jgi:hypothetical protein|uniref:hypothetical protein n=1 Tax=Phnomibacter sp. TaxID=2836217 RepID=UPI002FDEF77E|nr:hypothetical protein [Bacteroidota bacterium]
MKAYHIVTLLLLCSTTSYAQFHADVSAGFTTRLRPTVSAAALIHAHRAELAAIAAHELGHGTQIAGTIGLHMPTSTTAGDAVVLYAGGGYTWHTPQARAELTNKWYPCAGIKFINGWGAWELRYSSNTFQLLLGGRIFNRYK